MLYLNGCHSVIGECSLEEDMIRYIIVTYKAKKRDLSF